MRIWFVAGEASGDSHGAHVIEALRRMAPGVECEGLGGPRMQSAGMTLHHDLASEGIMGFVEVLKHAPRLKRLLRDTATQIRDTKPDAVVLIDYPGFNIRLATLLQGSGIPIIYYISPQVWAWKKGRLKTLVRVVTKMLVIFPFEEKLYREAGLACVFVGHPLVEVVNEIASAGAVSLMRGQQAWDLAPNIIGDQVLASGLKLILNQNDALLAISFVARMALTVIPQTRVGVAYRLADSLERKRLRAMLNDEPPFLLVHTIDNFAIRHAWKRHGNRIAELRRGQVAVTETDYILVPEITRTEYLVRTEVNDRGHTLLIYEKAINGWVVVAQEVRVGRRELAFVTMYKRPRQKNVWGEPRTTDEEMAQGPPIPNVQDDRKHQSSPQEILPQVVENGKSGEFSTTGGQMHPRTPALYVRDDRLRRFSPEGMVPQEEKKEKVDPTGEPMPTKDHAFYVRDNRKEQLSLNDALPYPAATYTIGLLPGSRLQEIARLFTPMLQIARGLLAQRPHLRFVAPCVNEARAAQLRQLAGDFPVEIQVGGMHDVLSTARFCFVASGTATLETALFGVPMIILYRVNPLTYAIARAVVDIEHIGMVNILAGRGVVPEFIQGAIKPAAILPVALSLIDDTPARAQMLADLREVRETLGAGGASERAAREILATIHLTRAAAGGASA